MRKRDLAVIFAIGLTIFLATSLWMTVPGYIDAEYYYSGGVQLFHGRGFSEPFLWNYLDNPQGIPHPSHTYWMPLPSIVAAAGMFVAGSAGFFQSRIFFIFLSAMIPVLTALTSFRLGGNRRYAWMAGLLAIFSGFYFVYMTDTETFTLYMFLGGVFFFWAFSQKGSKNLTTWMAEGFGLGILSGLMHLTRADGLLWLAAGAGFVMLNLIQEKQGGATIPAQIKNGAAAALFLAIGYLLVMYPWYARNLEIYGTLMSSGGSRTLWLTNYDQTFIYPASKLNMPAWLASGFDLQIKARINALGMNLKNLLAVQGEIFLLPFIAAGLWRFRKAPFVVLGIAIWIITLGFMTVIFPFSGSRGGFIHSGAAIQPLFWAVAPYGLESAIGLGVRWRKWNFQSASVFFQSGIILLSVLFTGLIFFQVVLGSDLSGAPWRASSDQLRDVWEKMQEMGAKPGDRVMVNNPPGFYLVSGQEAVPVPDGDLDAAVSAADRYEIQYMILDKNYTRGLKGVYEKPQDYPGIQYLGSIQDVQIYRFTGN